MLNIDDAKYKALSDKVSVKTIFEFLKIYGEGHLGLYYYIDVRGRFVPNKYKQDYIAQAIFDNLNSGDKMSILQYMEDLEEGEF